MGREIGEINKHLKFVNDSLDSDYRDKEILNIFIKRLKKAIQEGRQKDYNYDIEHSLKKDEEQLKSTEKSIASSEAHKLELEQHIQKLENNRTEIARDFGKLDAQLDEIMSRIEAFYKENYSD